MSANIQSASAMCCVARFLDPTAAGGVISFHMGTSFVNQFPMIEDVEDNDSDIGSTDTFEPYVANYLSDCLSVDTFQINQDDNDNDDNDNLEISSTGTFEVPKDSSAV